jgi:hypothetical protein
MLRKKGSLQVVVRQMKKKGDKGAPAKGIFAKIEKQEKKKKKTKAKA